MRLPFFFPPSIRSPYGFRSFAGACCICAVLASGNAIGQQLTAQDIEDAFYNALIQWGLDTSGEAGVPIVWPIADDVWSDFEYYLTYSGHTAAENTRLIYNLIRGDDPRFWNLLRSLSPTGSLDRIARSVGSISQSVTNMHFRADSHGRELLVAAPDLETILDDSFLTLFGYQQSIWNDVGSILYALDNGISVSIAGGEVSIDGNVDVNVLNWPAYFTGEYDQEVAEEITSAPSYEDDWDSYVSDTTDYAEDSGDDASEDSPYFADVTNAVGSVSLSTDDQDENLPIRDEVFNPISDDLLPASVVNRNFSSDVLILPAVPQFHIPELSWDGNDSAWRSFLSRSGSLMASLYDVFFALFVVWLIWREYNFYFRTM